MAGRSRRFSSTSVDESDGHAGKMKYIPERSALKSVARNSDPDDWPCYVLEDTTIYLNDGKTIGNLLHAELQSFFVVRGRLVVDGDLRSGLVSRKSNGEYIEVGDCQGFSIGSGPITLWAMGQSGWLEIRPSEKYQKMYNTMAEAISIYYFLTELYEEMRQLSKKKGSKIVLTIDQILLQFAIHDGTGLVRSDAAEKIQDHAEFLLSQMRKGGSILWKNTLFFKWLSAECQDIYAQLLEKAGEAAPSQTRIPLAVISTPIPQSPSPQPEPKLKSKTLPHHSRTPILPSTLSNPTIVLPPSDSSSNPAPTDLPESGAPLAIILALIRLIDADGSPPRARMTLARLGTLFYYKYSLKTVPLSQEIIRVNAKAILSSLDPEWKIAPIYVQLTEAASRPRKDDLRNQAMSVTEVKKRREASTIRKLPDGATGHGRRTLRTEKSSKLSPEPHASKSLLPPHSGRRSGKEAGLRLASNSAMKRDTMDAGSSDEDSALPARKRRRPSPPEMGDGDSDMDVPSPLAIPNGTDKEDESASHSGEDAKIDIPRIPTLKIISTALPSLEPTGPHGSWTCSRPSCSFIVRDAESEKGKEKITEHYNEHADTLERERLVKQEAAGRRLPIDHLLEKLRGLGESSRLREMTQEIIGGRVVPERIKRKGGLAV